MPSVRSATAATLAFYVVSALALGVLATQRPGFAIALIIGGFVVMSALYKPDIFACIAVGSTFFSRFSFEEGGFRVRAEMAVGIIAGIAILLKPRIKSLKVSSTVLVIMSAWLAWLTIVTFVVGPSFASSLTVLLWLALNILTVYYIVCFVSDVRVIVTIGIRLALGSAILGIAVWAIASLTGYKFLVQLDTAYGGYAAYGTLFEANILSSIVTLWSVVALSSRLCSHVSFGARLTLIMITPFLAIATHTRIALVGSVIVFVAAIVWLPRSRAYFAAMAVVVGIAMAVVTVDLSSLGLDKFTEPFALDEGTGRYRAVSWERAFQDLNESGWLAWASGLGANSFGQRHLDPSLLGTGARWYLGNLPLQLLYDGGFVSVILVVVGVVRVFPYYAWRIGSVFLAVYVLFAISTSTLWLLQSWIFLAIALVDRRQQEGGSVDLENTPTDSFARHS